MISLLNPTKIFPLIERIIFFFISIFFIILVIALTFALILSPPDYLQGDSVRIMYVHVPSAWVGLSSFTVIAILSFINFIFKTKNLNIIARSIAPIGLMFTCLALITGSIWGRPTWGVWWVWDARITSMVVLVLFYLFYILAHKFISQEERATKVSSMIALVGVINVPIIRYSVEWWNTLHQPASIKIDGTTTIHSSMLLPLMLMLLVILLYCALIFLMKYKTEIIRIKKKNLKRL